ncbi:MAG: adenylate kinase, partial [Xanthomonadales bacterium]|nr:adenylate kinase [Xanthomonadales bacterium]NIO13281.1 adenylate kinase [Xanthomonadales bacterium]NIQ98620.1 adenylate kinase [Gemmatimonadales bacterium]NIS64661.1 adenylate kinase [Gemmatimonadales bacterium]
MKVVFLGPPGAGKGTQADRMAEALDVHHASTGDTFRQAIAAGTRLGRTVQQYLDSGALVPDELTSRVVEQMVVEQEESYILDGYPRTLQQALDLERMLTERGQRLDGVIYFDVPEEVAVERLTGRLMCTECGANYHRKFMPPADNMICDRCGGPLKVRSDSSAAVVQERLVQFRQKTLPLLTFYEERDLLERVDATASPEEVSERTEQLLREMVAPQRRC